MEASSLTTTASPSGVLTRRTPLLRLQPDEKLVAMIREGHDRAFEVLFNRYQSRLLAFCRHLVGSPQDAEDVLQEVFAAAHTAILADDRAINARPWLYRIARNRSLNHLRRPTADGVDSMDVHPHENGTSTLERVQRREELRSIVSDVHELPETQRTALVLREIDDLSYTDIAHAMGTTLPSVKSLLVRARMSLAESSEARILTCDEVRLDLAEAAEGLRKLAGSTRRHVRDCPSCARYRGELRSSTKALAGLAPFGLLVLLRKLIPAKLGGSSGAGGTAGTATVGSAGGGAAGTAGGVAGTAGGFAAAGGSGMTLGGALSAASTAVTGIGGALGAKAAVGMATAALITAGAVSVDELDGQRATASGVSPAAIGPPAGLLPEGTPMVPVVADPLPPAEPVVEAAPPVEPAPVVELAPPVEPVPPAEPAPPPEPVATPAEDPAAEGPPADGGSDGGVVVDPPPAEEPPPVDEPPPPVDEPPPPVDEPPVDEPPPGEEPPAPGDEPPTTEEPPAPGTEPPPAEEPPADEAPPVE